ncbi:hypothetical protein KIN20_034638 [Parelaphostrongylus tenuis]|uniref:Uncharacterized protein n=1 Tax=Parelaphostrongylus tenuis TaxID=148309 RepID=A0AAD5WJW0_PARTN|nr:hypothetical protein KIN20_034638 [Parelaphostrongylus tenuis]
METAAAAAAAVVRGKADDIKFSDDDVLLLCFVIDEAHMGTRTISIKTSICFKESTRQREMSNISCWNELQT